MTNYFLDSSALVKRYITKQGTQWVRSLTTPRDVIALAQITQVEVVSSAVRRTREGTISLRDAYAIRLIVDRHSKREYEIVSLIDQVIALAEDLLQAHPLRAYDAIQLASALTANSRLIAAGDPPLIFLSADKRLLTAATAEGLTVDDPNNYP